MRFIRLLPLCLLLLVVALPGCKRDGATPGAAAGATSTGAADAAVVDGDSVAALSRDDASPPELGEFRVVSVLLGDALDGEHIVRAARSDFDAGATIHASVLSVGAHPGLTLSARWHGPGGDTILETAQAIAPTQPTATTFTLQDRAPWPAGDYVFELLANGHRLQTVPFSVH